jgi:CBS domain containing-hemolysin-like protein
MVLSAFFSGVEIAFIAANKLHFELQNKQGTFAAKLLAPFFQRPSRFISTMLVGHSLALVIFGIYASQHFLPYLLHFLPANVFGELAALFLQIVLAGGLMLVLTELLPKPFFLLNADRCLELLAIPIWVSFYVLYFPLGWLVLRLYKFIVINIVRVEYVEDKPIYRMIDLSTYLQNTTMYSTEEPTDVPTINAEILSNALTFREVRVGECMIPRLEIIGLDIEAGIDALQALFMESGHSKLLIYRAHIDNVLGYCHILTMMAKPTDIQAILTPCVITDINTPAEDLLKLFSTEKKSVALVVDALGNTEGIVCLEDIVEKIFGEIEDEYDED